MYPDPALLSTTHKKRPSPCRYLLGKWKETRWKFRPVPAACIQWLTRMAKPRNGEIWPERWLKIDSDQNICAWHCLIVPWCPFEDFGWRRMCLKSTPLKNVGQMFFGHIFPILYHISNQSSSSTPLVHLNYILNEKPALSWTNMLKLSNFCQLHRELILLLKKWQRGN